MKKIILGLGNNIDYEVVWDSNVLESLIKKYNISNSELSTDIEVNNERDLVISILAFLKTGTGGERFVSDSTVLESFAQHFEYSITLGGTSVRAAIAMRKLGYTSALHLVTMNDDVRRCLPDDCSYVCSAQKEAYYPHLIIQFCKGSMVQGNDIHIVAERSNRIIYDYDIDNIEMKLNEQLSDVITDARVFLISGFNTMRSSEKLQKRIKTLRLIMEDLPRKANVFYEDACYHKSEFRQIVIESLIDLIDVFSFNEDELQEYVGRSVDLLDPICMKQALLEVQQMIPSSVLILHTQYYALAYGKHTYAYQKALEAGVLMAGTRFRYGDDFTEQQYNEMKQYPRQQLGIEFAAVLREYIGDNVCCVSGLAIDEKNATTIGLGDSFVGGFLPELCHVIK